MYNEIVLAKLYTCLEHIEAIERYLKVLRILNSFLI
jgi:hypothetical protein